MSDFYDDHSDNGQGWKQPRICQRVDCLVVFIPQVWNQRFHDRECTRLATNEKILKQYHERKNQDLKGRVCAARGCGTILSRYNSDTKCGSCQEKDLRRKLEAWGWDLDEDTMLP